MDKQDAQSVTQDDREAAASFYQDHLARPGEVPVAAAMRMGHIDESPLIQAFARHRLASQPTSAEDAVVILTCLCGGVNKRAMPYDMGKADSCDHCDCANFGHYSTASRPTPDTQTAATSAEAMRETLLFVRKAIWPFRMRTEETSDAVALIDSTLDELSQPEKTK